MTYHCIKRPTTSLWWTAAVHIIRTRFPGLARIFRAYFFATIAARANPAREWFTVRVNGVSNARRSTHILTAAAYVPSLGGSFLVFVCNIHEGAQFEYDLFGDRSFWIGGVWDDVELGCDTEHLDRGDEEGSKQEADEL